MLGCCICCPISKKYLIDVLHTASSSFMLMSCFPPCPTASFSSFFVLISLFIFGLSPIPMHLFFLPRPLLVRLSFTLGCSVTTPHPSSPHSFPQCWRSSEPSGTPAASSAAAAPPHSRARPSCSRAACTAPAASILSRTAPLRWDRLSTVLFDCLFACVRVCI